MARRKKQEIQAKAESAAKLGYGAKLLEMANAVDLVDRGKLRKQV